MIRQTALTAVLALASHALPAQADVVVRDTIVALPLASFCMDGATHVTEVTGLRLRAPNTDLKALVGKALEIRGKKYRLNCERVDVSSIREIGSKQSSATSVQSGIAQVEFFGDVTPGMVYMLYGSGGLLDNPIFLPTVDGPIHVDPASMVLLGAGATSGTALPYLTMTAPLTPAMIGVEFFNQAVVYGAFGIQMSNIDVFEF